MMASPPSSYSPHSFQRIPSPSSEEDAVPPPHYAGVPPTCLCSKHKRDRTLGAFRET